MTESREKIAAHLAEARGATLVPSFDDAWIIEGQGSAGIEAMTQMDEVELGRSGAGGRAVRRRRAGGGHRAGAARGARSSWSSPRAGTTCAAALEAGWIEPVGDNPPPTACDALQTLEVSPLTFDVLSRRGAHGLAVSEAEVREAQRWAARTLKLVVEPGGAVALAALLAAQGRGEPGTLVILSGGNVDPDAYGAVLAGSDCVDQRALGRHRRRRRPPIAMTARSFA